MDVLQPVYDPLQVVVHHVASRQRSKRADIFQENLYQVPEMSIALPAWCSSSLDLVAANSPFFQFQLDDLTSACKSEVSGHACSSQTSDHLHTGPTEWGDLQTRPVH